MSWVRRVRAEGRKAAIAALVLALALGATVFFVASALAAPKPPAPSITGFPNNPTATVPPATTAPASFSFSDSQAGVSFQCQIDGSAFTPCASPKSYPPLVQGNHTFGVQAVSGSQTSGTTSFSWAIVPPAPTIAGHPNALTNATTAQFTFTDGQAGVGFKCALDSNNFSSCTTPKSYSGLSGGSHTFQVEAVVGNNPPSAPASFTWTIDLSAPTITISFPADGGAYNAAGWTGGCSPAGICGTANDPAGVQAVAVALLQQSSNKYWNGSTFASSSIVFNTATVSPANGTSVTWKYGKTLPADGKYTVSVRATDTFGNTTANGDLKKATFTIDTQAPPAPVLTGKPSNPSKDKTPEFEFINTDPTVTFTCKLDSGALTPCTGDSDHDGDSQGEHNEHGAFGEIQYGTLTAGNHCFNVYATDPAGNVGPTTQYCWTISGTVTATTITATAGTPQYATLNTAFGTAFKATVTGAGNVPVPNVQVTFTAPSSGASGTFASCSGGNPQPYSCLVTTNASGVATASTFTANSTSGSYTVTATTPGVATPANFSLINSANFTIYDPATPISALIPGSSIPMNLRITNPNPSPITIPVGGITIGVHNSKTGAGCADSNFGSASNLVALTIPANAVQVSLSSLAAPANNPTNWPHLQMLETGTNQDVCKAASLTLTYGGSATG